MLRRKSTLVSVGSASGPVPPFPPPNLTPNNFKLLRPTYEKNLVFFSSLLHFLPLTPFPSSLSQHFSRLQFSHSSPSLPPCFSFTRRLHTSCYSPIFFAALLLNLTTLHSQTPKVHGHPRRVTSLCPRDTRPRQEGRCESQHPQGITSHVDGAKEAQKVITGRGTLGSWLSRFRTGYRNIYCWCIV